MSLHRRTITSRGTITDVSFLSSLSNHHSKRICRLEVGFFALFLFFVCQFVLLYLHLDLMKPFSAATPTLVSAPKTTASEKQRDRFSSPKKKQYSKLQNRNHRWDPGLDGLSRDPLALKINLPVFVPSLPKSGTTSIWQYFNCGGHRASHQWVKLNSSYTEQSATCIERNIRHNLPPFSNCGDYQVFTDTGFANFPLNKNATSAYCYYPSVQAMDSIAAHYPKATILSVVRNTTSWYESMLQWGDGSLLKRWTYCNLTGWPRSLQAEELERFYDWHAEYIREFCRSHPSLTCLEVSLESADTGRILEDRVGIPRQCWARCTPYSKFCRPVTQ